MTEKTFSVYLDLLRFLAAIAVFLHHMGMQTERYDLLERYGDDAVMVFFVLSGYVIAYVTDQKERIFADYASSRLARLYSVAVPTIALTVLLDYLSGNTEHSSSGLIRMVITMTFSNQLWGIDIKPWSNSPYWSISYEFWYYAFFAIAAFAKRKALLFTAWAVIVGPCIILLLPVWYVGAWVYRYRPVISQALGWALALAPIAAYLAYNFVSGREALLSISNLEAIAPFGLHKARFWLHDYAIGLMVAAHFIGARIVCQRLSFDGLVQPIRSMAAYTFTLYLLHLPLQKAIIAIYPLATWANDAVVICATVIVVYLVGLITERRKAGLRRFFLLSTTVIPLRLQRLMSLPFLTRARSLFR